MNWYHNSYSEEAEEEMRAEAENRVQAMQERAKLIHETFSPPGEFRPEMENRAPAMQEQARWTNSDFRPQGRPPPPPPSFPPSPSQAPSMPSSQTPPMPSFQTPPMPSFQTSSMPSFQTPSMPFQIPSMPGFLSNLFPPSKPSGGPALFGLDSDKLMILALIWILWRENCDIKLLLALLYLLL